jgi:hypothetical protein
MFQFSYNPIVSYMPINTVRYGIEFSLEDVQQLYAADFLCVCHRPALMLRSLLGLLGVLSLSAPVLELRIRRLGASALYSWRRRTRSWQI